MSLSIIWKLSDDESRNLTTIQCLKEQIAGNEFETQILIYTKDKSKSAEYVTELELVKAKVDAYEADDEVAVYMDAQKHVTEDLVTYISSGDQWTSDALKQVQKAADKYTKYNIFMLHKTMLDGDDVAFTTDPATKNIIGEHFEIWNGNGERVLSACVGKRKKDDLFAIFDI